MGSNASILIVDDSPMVVRLLQSVLGPKGYNCKTAASAEEAQRMLSEERFELILSDINMPPGRSGLELIKEVREHYPETAAIMFSGSDSQENGNLALELGAFGYIIKPFNNTELLINVQNALIRRKLKLENQSYQEALQQEVLERTKELMGTIHRLEAAEKKVRRSQEETIHRLAMAAEFRDNETAQHTVRMSLFCELIARRLGLDDERCELIRSASPMHDIGKIGITDTVLLKPGKHTPEERKLMQRHAEFGYEILRDSDSELLQLGAVIAWTHHEKFDGSGYPRGLKGEDIPLEGRITAVADVFDALTSARVYKRPYSMENALDMMTEESGRHFEPLLLELFKENQGEVHAIRERFSDAAPFHPALQ